MNPPGFDDRASSAHGDGVGQKPSHEKDARFKKNPDRPSPMRRAGEGSPLDEILRWLARSFAILALLSSFALLCVGATPFLTHLPAHIARSMVYVSARVKDGPLSALALILAGSAYILSQAILRPPPMELFKRLMLGIAFLLWGIVELMPTGNLSAELGNVVISLYVVDLGLIIWTTLKKQRTLAR